MKSEKGSDDDEDLASDSEQDFVEEEFQNNSCADGDLDDLEVRCAKQNYVLYSKDKSVLGFIEISNIHGRVAAENVISESIGIKKYAASRIKNIRDCFEVCFSEFL